MLTVVLTVCAYIQVEKKMLMFVLNPLRHIVATITHTTALIIFLKRIIANKGRDSLRYMLTGAVLVDQVGNVENTCYPFFQADLPDS